MNRSSLAVVLAAGCAVLGGSGRAFAAPPKKQCIAAAESAQQLRSRGHLIEARKALAACTATACPAVVRRDCGRWIEEIDAAQPSVTVKLEDRDGRDVTEGRVLIDGSPMQPATDGRATLLDPGVHTFVWAAEAGNVAGNVEREVVVREGERNRVILLRMAPAAVASPVTEPPPPPPPAPRPLPYVVGGVGIALAGAGGILWGIGLHDRSNLSSSCAAAHACAQHDIDASRTKLIVGDVLVGASLIAVASALFLFLNRNGTATGTAAPQAGPVGVLSGFSAPRPFLMRLAPSSDRAFER